jgi:hypothetical protein
MYARHGQVKQSDHSELRLEKKKKKKKRKENNLHYQTNTKQAITTRQRPRWGNKYIP